MTDSREHILKISFSLFLQKNFKEVTMSEIVAAAGLSKGAFYHYFASKEQLFVEVINTFYFNRMVIDYGRLSNESLWAFYHDYARHAKIVMNDFRNSLDSHDSRPNINYLTMMFDALKLFPGFRDKVSELQQKELAAWAAVIKVARENGEFSSPMSDEQIARMFIYSGEGVALYLLFSGSYDTADQEMLTLWDNFYKELKD